MTPNDRACAHAICAGLVGIGKSELAQDDQARRRKFAERAVVLLRQAVSGGDQNPNLIESDIDIDAIKSNDDFRAVLAELRAKPTTNRAVAPGS